MFFVFSFFLFFKTSTLFKKGKVSSSSENEEKTFGNPYTRCTIGIGMITNNYTVNMFE